MSDTRECLRILGGPGCGKTTTLLEHAREKAEKGARLVDLLFIVPSEQARYEAALKVEKLGFAALRERIMTIHQLGVAILDTEDARAFTGRVPYVLNSVEELFLLEDLKITGVKPRRLREMLNYFYRCFTEMEDEREDFIQDIDELSVMTLLKEQLRVRGAMLPAELSAMAFRYLVKNQGALRANQCPHVFVDDYNGLNRASQMVTGLLASGSLSVAGNNRQAIACSEPYPYPRGIKDFAEGFPQARTLELKTARRTPQKITSIGNALAWREDSEDEGIFAGIDPDSRQGIVRQVKWLNPASEFAGIARYVAGKISVPVDRLQSDEIFIGVPNRLWGRLLLRELEARKVPVSPALHPRKLPGNPQKRETSVAMRAFTALCLASDPRDLVAWRSWIGFGDHLLNSPVWSRFCAWYHGQSSGPLAAGGPLAAVKWLLSEEAREDGWGGEHSQDSQDSPGCQDYQGLPFLQAERLIEGFRRGREVVARLVDRQGFALVKALEELFGPLPDEFIQLVEPLDGVETARELSERARQRLFDPCFLAGGVRLGTYEAVQYLEPRLVVLAGLVNGLIPTDAALDPLGDPEQQKRAYQRQAELLHRAITRASDELVLSYFQKEELSNAGRLKLSVSRIRVDHGVRTAVTAPSVYFDEMGPALPGAESAL
jgi:DNA helicase-2/ATP-dependent DNA helicase PcrA